METSTADRSPPIVMSSPAHGGQEMFSIDAICPHTWARNPSRQLEVAECRCKLFLSILCGVSRAVQAVLQQPAHVFVTCLVILWRLVMECRNTPFARRQVPQLFPPRLPMATPDSTTFRASSGGVEAYNSGLACVLCPFATHLARTLVFPGLSLPLSTHRVLVGAIPVSRRHVSLWALSCTSCDDECTPISSRLALATAQDQETHLRCHPNATLATS